MKKYAGFTLIELLIVIVLISIIAVIALPNFLSTKERAIRASMISDLRNLVVEQESYYASNSTYVNDIADLTDVRASQNNTITLNSKSNSPKGWFAEIKSDELDEATKYCTIFIGINSDGDEWPTVITTRIVSSNARELSCTF